ncbi:AAA-domain-containing protein [Patellaria atrata CBS 101060]|uniref:AAA-domain-containing protein n=1 Tax=Patellaria atrata CBS 101060 TaxID=1346257 RepID=A0A9P4S8F1_9PEZI|nr:AAA-domain-containing protein [Patellaria atrata CBS 101060]
MSSRTKRRLQDFDPTASDPEDLDYGAEEPTRPQRRSKKKPKGARKPPLKKVRRGYADTDDDEDDSEISQESYVSSIETEEDTEVNPRTGRKVRNAAKKPVKYEESDEEEGFLAEIASDRDEIQPTPRKRGGKQQSLIVKLKVPSMVRNLRSRSGSKTVQRGKTPEVTGTRRSSRLSHDETSPIVELSNSGRHEVVIRQGTQTPEPPTRRQRGGKGLKSVPRVPSMIFEATEEQSGESAQNIVDELQEAAGMEVSGAEEHASEGGSPAASDTQADAEHEEIKMIEEAVAESIQGDNEEDEEGPIISKSRTSRSRNSPASEHDSELDHEELAEEAEELAELNAKNRRSRRTRRNSIVYDDQPKLRNRSTKPDYRIFRPELALTNDDDEALQAATPSRNRRGGASVYRSLFSIQGPFGGAGGPPPLFGGAQGAAAAGGVDSDSSDDDMASRAPRGLTGGVGMTPTTAGATGLYAQAHNADPLQTGSGGGPANFGKITKDKKALADVDPLGVEQSVNFEAVGGLDDHINRLKEMVALPLLYPEVFQQLNVTPPRGVLFHGPPGTGKTLLARALASSVSSQGRKVTFYMRKGADALSKWVGEAERQLRLLFEEARKNQPSIIFFDEIDGLAPVRSSKQEQIHASIVATLLALMDGMDGRGQVIVIGATNRPDSVDPALRRPGRFDREFYFPLPTLQARRAIIDIHTKGWNPPLKAGFKDQLAELTKGYGGADLRALCTEAALNAVQGTYPEIYKSNQKLIIDPTTIKVQPKDFMISINKMIPSSERSGSSSASALPKDIEPLLRHNLKAICQHIDEILPQKKKLTALEEAQYDDREDEHGLERETMNREFDRARIFRPRLLLAGPHGMGQQYLGAAILHKFETLHVQSFDLPALLEDSSRSNEAAIVQLFKEVRRHKPSVICIPNVNIWYDTVSPAAIKTFVSQLRSLPPNDQLLVLGFLELDKDEKPDQDMLRDLFGYSKKNVYDIKRPDNVARQEFFANIFNYIRMQPTDFPHPESRKLREPRTLEIAPAVKGPEGPTKEELKAQKKQDRHTLNLLKLQIQPVMDQIKNKYKKFRNPPIDDGQIQYLYDEQDPEKLTTDLSEAERQAQQMHRPFEMAHDKNGVPGLRDTINNKFFYNLEIVMIEKRLSNGYYKRPKDFLADIKRLAKDAKALGDPERTLKANEMVANVEVDMQFIEAGNPALVVECEAVYAREKAREKELAEKAKKSVELGTVAPTIQPNVPPSVSATATETTGPVVLGEHVPGPATLPPVTPIRHLAPSIISNGFSSRAEDSNHAITNGSTVPSRQEEDVRMEDSQERREQPAGNTQSQLHHFMNVSQANTQTQRSQKSALTQVFPGSQINEYHNSASTTTSGQKTSDRSNRSSGPYTQSTNGQHPDFYSMRPASGGFSLPDTQLDSSQQTNSQSSQQQSQFTMPAPPRGGTSINSVLNPQQSTVIVDEQLLAKLHRELVEKSSGLSVEQLEQVNSVLMDAIWKMRGQWNRNVLIQQVTHAFNDIIKDIEEMQEILSPSQENNKDKE